MKKYILIASLILFYFPSCTNKKAHDHEHNHAEHDIAQCTVKVHDHQAMLAVEPTDGSIFNLTSTWTDQYGKPRKLSDLGSKKSIVSMVYTHCEYACPRIVADMEAIKTELSKNSIEAQNINYVLISIDPARDTPERLMEFYKENNFDNDWVLLTGNEESVMEMAAVLGVQYKSINSADFSHSNLISVLNSNGEIIHQQQGLGTSPEETVAYILDEKLLSGN